ncbi:hypothetical protein Tco_1257940 [Tanacetum coccineum]
MDNKAIMCLQLWPWKGKIRWVALQAPPSPDYIPGPKEPQSPPYTRTSLRARYNIEYLCRRPEDEDEVFLAKEQPLPVAASPTAQSPDYVPESDPEEDLEEDDDEDPEEDPVDYPADGGDDGDDEDEPSDDDEDEEVDIEGGLPICGGDKSHFEDGRVCGQTTAPPAISRTDRIFYSATIPKPVWVDARGCTDFTSAILPTSSHLPHVHHNPQIPSPTIPPINHHFTSVSSPPKPHLLPITLPLPHHPSYSPTPGPDAPLSGTTTFAFTLTEERGNTRGYLTTSKEVRYRSWSYSRSREWLGYCCLLEPAGCLRADMVLLYTMDREIRRDLKRDSLRTRVRRDNNKVFIRGWDDEQDWATAIGWSAHHVVLGWLCTFTVAGSGPQETGGDYRVAGSGPQETGGDYRVAGSGQQETDTVH